jgi:hypothetical protein
VFLVASIPSLPAVVASHFSAGGVADGFMPRDMYVLFMGAVSLGLPLAIGALLSQMHRLPVSLINIPNRAYWLAPERADASRQYLARHGNVFMALLVAFMCFVHWQVVDANRTQPPRLAEGPVHRGAGAVSACHRGLGRPPVCALQGAAYMTTHLSTSAPWPTSGSIGGPAT